MRAADFHSKSKHEEGTKVLLKKPDGTLTEEFVVLLGRDSEAFRRAQAKYRDNSVQAQADDKTFDSYVEGVKLTASAIKSWSLEDDCNEKNATELLLNAPYILDQLDAALYDSKRFFS